MIFSIFQIANIKPQISASNNQIREHRIETKVNHYTIKILITVNKHIINLPTIEAETLIRTSFDSTILQNPLTHTYTYKKKTQNPYHLIKYKPNITKKKKKKITMLKSVEEDKGKEEGR